MNRDTCERGSCDRPQVAHGLCRTHYGREYDQSRHRHREGKVLRSRARSRAVTQLVAAHREEYDRLFAAAEIAVREEAARLAAIAAAAGAEVTGDRKVLRLRPGPASIDDEPVEDRVRLIQPVQCKTCDNFHESGHKCPTCEVPTGERAQLARKSPEQRIRYFLEAGKAARWIVDQGETRATVLAVMSQMRAEKESATA